MTEEERFHAFVRAVLVAAFGLFAVLFVFVVIFISFQVRYARESRDDLNYLVHLQCPSGVSVATCRGWAKR